MPWFRRYLRLGSNRQTLDYLARRSPLALWDQANRRIFADQKTPHTPITVVSQRPLIAVLLYGTLPVNVTEKQDTLVFEVPVLSCDPDSAEKLAGHLQRDPVELLQVFPYALPAGPDPDDGVRFVVAGALPRTVLPEENADRFMIELAHTYFYLIRRAERILGPGNDPHGHTDDPSHQLGLLPLSGSLGNFPPPGWIQHQADLESQGGRSAEFELGPHEDDDPDPRNDPKPKRKDT